MNIQDIKAKTMNASDGNKAIVGGGGGAGVRQASAEHYKEEAASRQLSHSAALENKC